MGNIVNSSIKNGILVISVTGRVDSTNSAEMEKEISAIVDTASYQLPVLDLSDLEYISSAGLRVLMKLRKQYGRPLKIDNAPGPICEILETTGFTELFEVTRKPRVVSVEGCPIIGKGYYGTVYRLDAETIVKVYRSPDSIPMIRNEKELARTALVAGVPTAISYDIVRVGDSYGSVFELLDAKTLNDRLIEEPQNTDEIVRLYAEFLHMVNSNTVPMGRLRSSKEQFIGYLDTVKTYLDDDVYEKIKALFAAVPEKENIVHGDAQMKNIMISNGEPMLIDMDTLSQGHPIFDIQAVFVTYFAFGEDDPNNSMDFIGVPEETTARVWEKFPGYYLGTDDPAQVNSLRDKISLVGCIRFLFLINVMDGKGDELFKLRVKHTRERLRTLADRVETLDF